MKRFFVFLSFLIFSVSIHAQTPKYIFFFIGDGMGINTARLANLYNKSIGQPELTFPFFPVRGYLDSSVADNLWPDSSGAGSSIASGVKCLNWNVGIDGNGNNTTTVTDLLKKKGYGVGIVSSDGLSLATPASFFAHTTRDDYSGINKFLINSNIDFFAGSNICHHRRDTINQEGWISAAKAKGWNVFRGKEEYRPVKGGQVIYLSDKDMNQLAYRTDTREGDMIIEDFCEKAIEYFQDNYMKKGFFLLIEEGNIDHSIHSQDLGTTIREVNALQSSVNMALEFLKKHPRETLIIITADHESGGITLGMNGYQDTIHPEYFQYQNISMDNLTKALNNLRTQYENEVPWSAVKALISERTGLWSHIPVDPEREKKLTLIYKETFIDGTAGTVKNWYSVNSKMSSYAIHCVAVAAKVSCASNTHTCAPVPYYVKGAGQNAFAGCTDNTNLTNVIVNLLKLK